MLFYGFVTSNSTRLISSNSSNRPLVRNAGQVFYTEDDIYPYIAALPQSCFGNFGPIPGILWSLGWHKINAFLISKGQAFSDSLLIALMSDDKWSSIRQLKEMGHKVNKSFQYASDEETINTLAEMGLSPTDEDVRYILRTCEDMDIFNALYSLFAELFVFVDEDYREMSTEALAWLYINKLISANTALSNMQEILINNVISLFSTDDLAEFGSHNRLHLSDIRRQLNDRKREGENNDKIDTFLIDTHQFFDIVNGDDTVTESGSESEYDD